MKKTEWNPEQVFNKKKIRKESISDNTMEMYV